MKLVTKMFFNDYTTQTHKSYTFTIPKDVFSLCVSLTGAGSSFFKNSTQQATGRNGAFIHDFMIDEDIKEGDIVYVYVGNGSYQTNCEGFSSEVKIFNPTTNKEKWVLTSNMTPLNKDFNQAVPSVKHYTYPEGSSQPTVEEFYNTTLRLSRVAGCTSLNLGDMKGLFKYAPFGRGSEGQYNAPQPGLVVIQYVEPVQ